MPLFCHASYGKMQYKQREFHELVSRFGRSPLSTPVPPPPACSPPPSTSRPSNYKHYVLSEVELATFRTQLCESHQKNRCAQPDACPHSHCLTWQRRNPYEIIYDPHLCPGIEFRRSNSKMSLIRHCTRGRSCAYAHSKEEELYHPLMYKTKLCTVFPNCDRHYCPFAHSTEEMRHPFNNPLIRYIWGSSSAVDCSQSTSSVQGWAVSPFASLKLPFVAADDSHLPSLSKHLPNEQPHGLELDEHVQFQQQQIGQDEPYQRWTQSFHQTTHRQSAKQLHTVASTNRAASPPYMFALQQQHEQQQQGQCYIPDEVDAAKQTRARIGAKQVLSKYSYKHSMLRPPTVRAAGSPHTFQKPSLVQQSRETLHTMRTAPGEETAGEESIEFGGTERRIAGDGESVLGQPLSAERVLRTSGPENRRIPVESGSNDNEKLTLPAASDTTSATTTTVSTDLHELFDSESLRRALIMTLAQQLIGPQVNQLSVDQVLLVLDLAVKLAAQMQSTPPVSSIIAPSLSEELVDLNKTAPDSPQDGSSVLPNTAAHALNPGPFQQKTSSGNRSRRGSLQSDDTRLQGQQQQTGTKTPVSAAPRAPGLTTPCAHPPHHTTTDESLGDTTSSSLFDPQVQDADSTASLAATQMLIEQLRKLNLLDVGEGGARSCSSPAPSLEEVETSSLSIVRGSTGLWSTSTSPMVGGAGDIPSGYATMSSKHGDLIPTTAITAAATTFASATSSADEDSLCPCPPLTLAQDISPVPDKHHHLLHISRASSTKTTGLSATAYLPSCVPSNAKAKLCTSPAEGMSRQQDGRLAQRGGNGGGSAYSVATDGRLKALPSFSSLLGGQLASPQLRGLLPPPHAHETTATIEEAAAEVLSATCQVPLIKGNTSICFNNGLAARAAGAFPLAPPVQQQQVDGSFLRTQFFPDVSTLQQQDTSLQKRTLPTGTFTASRKLSEPFSPQLTTCSPSPFAGQINSPQCCSGGGSSAEATSTYDARLADGISSGKHSFSQGTKCNRVIPHGSRNALSSGQYRQHMKTDIPRTPA